MSLAVALPCAAAAAAVYGTSTALQHQRVAAAADRPLTALLRDPRWLASVGGDGLGLVLQVIALAAGPVVLIAPLLVLAVPVALPVGWALGGPPPRRREIVAVAGVVAALAVFLVVVGDPGEGRAMTFPAAWVLGLIALVISGVAYLLTRRPSTARAAVVGAVAGAGFALVATFINTLSAAYEQRGAAGLVDDRAAVTALIGVLAVGAAAMTLTQLSFRTGALGASFAANEATTPIVAVVLGAALLEQRVPFGAGRAVIYLVCVAVLVLSIVELASGDAETPDAAGRMVTS